MSVKKKRMGYFAALCLVALGAMLVYFGTQRTVPILWQGGMQTVQTRSFKIANVLDQAGIALGPYDYVFPDLEGWLGWADPIRITYAHQTRLIDETRHLDVSIPSRERRPANLLLEVGILLFPGDLILSNGLPVDPASPLPVYPSYVLQIVPAQKVLLQDDQVLKDFYSVQPTLGQALWEAGIKLRAADYLSASMQQNVAGIESVDLRLAQPVKIHFKNQTLSTLTAAPTIGQALNQTGIILEGEDFTVPAEQSPIPKSGDIEVVSVREEVTIEQIVLPYTSESVMDSQLELDQVRVIEAGQYGLQLKRQRIRYENEIETSRNTEAEWIASEPKPEKIGVGTQIVLKVVETPQGPMEYWRSVNAYATSYSPCRSGIDGCSYGTASGMELKQGVVAVVCRLFSTFRGQQVFIPGYGVGTIGDCGGGIPGTFWVDLGYSDDDYVSWHQVVTVYFLAPAPAYIPYDIQ